MADNSWNAWSEEEDDFLKRQAASGLSATEAAQQLGEVFGTARTRSAVLGRAHRLGVAFAGGSGLRSARNPAQIAAAAKGLAAIAARTANRTPAQQVATERNGAAGREAAKAKSAASAKLARPSEKADRDSAAKSLPALKPPARQKHNVHNIKVKATRHLDERFDAIRTQRLAEVAAFEAKLAQSGGVNPGVLFMERDMTKHCAAPMPGWDSAPIDEKRVCGAPVEWRSVQVGEAGFSMEPTSWCSDCRKRFTVAATERRADLGKLASIDKSVRRAAA